MAIPVYKIVNNADRIYTVGKILYTVFKRYRMGKELRDRNAVYRLYKLYRSAKTKSTKAHYYRLYKKMVRAYYGAYGNNPHFKLSKKIVKHKWKHYSKKHKYRIYAIKHQLV